MSEPAEAYDLSGRSAVVTGAASGIGRAVARLLAAAGASLALGDVDEAGLEATRAGLGSGTSALLQRCDVTRADEIAELVERAADAFGRLDVLANVAGAIHDGTLAETREADLDRLLDVNLKGVWFGCQAVLPHMRARRSGSIVNVASSAAFRPLPGLAAYSVSKAAVVALTRVLAAEEAGAGVRVNAVAPGMVDTPMAARRARDADGRLDPAAHEAVLAEARRRSPLGVEGRPEDIAHGVLYLAADASRYMTGQVLHLNGGSPMV